MIKIKHLGSTLWLALLLGCTPKTPPDMAMDPPDMLVEEDLTMEEEDLRRPPDLRADLMVPPDLSPPPDLKVDPDLRQDPDLSMPTDMTMTSGDMALGMGKIGVPCTADADCSQGPTPVCWKSTVRNQMGAPATPGGYCSSTCATDADCGTGARCADVLTGKFCLARCGNATTCRKPGYACSYYATDGVCYPDTIFNCDPTVGLGTCTEAGTMKAGGCIRGAYENKGTCTSTCTLAAGSCVPLSGVARQCIYYDNSPDVWKGLVCASKPAAPVAAGGSCTYSNECTEGYQCDGRDSKCRQLCMKGGMPACMIGMCSDAFMTGATGAGLCR